MKNLSQLGYIFLIIGLFGIYTNFSNQTTQYIVWFCNHSAIIIGLAILYNSRAWLSAQISLGLFPQLVWSLDYLSKLFTDNYLFNITNYMFDPTYPTSMYVMSLNHLIMTPLALYIVWQLKPKLAWKEAMTHIILLIPISLSYPAKYNLNCLVEPCVPFLPSTLYTIYYPILVLTIAYLTNRFILYLYHRTSTL